MLQDGARVDGIVKLAKAAKKGFRMGKVGGAPKYTDQHDLAHLALNKREKEALNLNYAALWEAWLALGT